jgi:hypothetical protein
MSAKNVFNPEDIQAGDLVVIVGESKPMVVLQVSGKNGNKVYCHEIGRELYATCFKKVSSQVGTGQE